MGERVSLPHGIEGYLASGDGAGLGVLVLGNAPPTLCDRFAAEGFTALALATGGGGDGGDSDAPALSAAIDYLVDHPAVRGHGVAVVGFGGGGAQALRLAGLRPDQVRAAVPFYATLGGGDGPDWEHIEAAVEGHYGDQDDTAPLESARELEQLLNGRGKDVRLFVYPGAGHDFFDDTRVDAYDEDAARQAWVRTLEFLRAKLG